MSPDLSTEEELWLKVFYWFVDVCLFVCFLGGGGIFQSFLVNWFFECDKKKDGGSTDRHSEKVKVHYTRRVTINSAETLLFLCL